MTERSNYGIMAEFSVRTIVIMFLFILGELHSGERLPETEENSLLTSKMRDITSASDPVSLYLRAKESTDESAQNRVERAALGLIHLQQVYDIPLFNFSAGVIYQRRCAKLSREDYRLLGYIALINDLEDGARLWLSASERNSSLYLKSTNVYHQVTTRSQSDVRQHRTYHWLNVFQKILAAELTTERLDATQWRNLDHYLESRRVESGGRIASTENEIFHSYSALCRGGLEKETPNLSCCELKRKYSYGYWKVELLHRKPDVTRFYEIITSSEIERIMALSRSELVPSDTVHDDGAVTTDPHRMSYSVWLEAQDVVTTRLEQKISEVTGLHVNTQDYHSNAEYFQVGFYPAGGLYASHYDTLGDAELPDYIADTGDRMATFMFYLNDVELGGATVFPKLNLRIPSIKGSAVFWYNLHSDGSLDEKALHGGCPVVFGTKWVLNKWIHERGQFMTRPCYLKPGL